MAYYTVFNTEFGWIAIVGSEAGLRRLTTPQPSPDKALKLIADLIPKSVANSSYFSELAFRLQLYFEGNKVEQQHLPDRIKDHVYYEPTENGHEKRIKEWLEKRHA